MNNYLDLIDYGRIEDLYKLSRFCYRVGEPIISDADYDILHNYCKENSILVDYVNRSYDDDPIPVSLLEEFNLTNLTPKFSESSSIYSDFINGETSMSIRPIGSFRECFEYCMSTKDKSKTLSIKINGVNIKGVVDKEDDGYFYSKVFRTRGRNGDSFDITRNMNRIFNNKVKDDSFITSDGKVLDPSTMYITGESYVVTSSLGKLVSPSGLEIRVPRSGAMSMLRTDYNDEDYTYLKYKIFRCEGLTNSSYENLQILKRAGYDVVPMIKIEPEEIPSTYEEFCEWLKEKMDYFKSICDKEFIQADGLVMDVDDVNYIGDINGQYSNKNVALKFYHWSHKFYKAKVKEIIIEQQAVNCSVVLGIEPLTLDDFSEARRVNVHSLGILISEGITVGSDIWFKRHSEVYNVLVYGTELKELMGY